MQTNKFWGESSSEESEESYESSYETEEESNARTAPAKPGGYYGYSDSDDDYAPLKRTITSTREKRFGEISQISTRIVNHFKIDDFRAALNDYEALNKTLKKVEAVCEKEHLPFPPQEHLKILVFLEDNCLQKKEESKKDKKKFSATNAKALTTLFQRVRKNNRDYSARLEALRITPSDADTDTDASDSAEDSGEAFSSDESGSDLDNDDAAAAASENIPKKNRFFGSDSESDSGEESGEWSFSSESFSYDEPQEGGGSKASKWMTKSDDKKLGEKTKKERKKDKGEKSHKQHKETGEAGDSAESKTDIFADPDTLTPEILNKALQDVLGNRGKKNTDRLAQLRLLKKIADHSFDLMFQAKALTHLVAAQFDYPPDVLGHMSISIWITCCKNIVTIIRMLNTLHRLSLPMNESTLDFIEKSLLGYIERLDDEFIKSLQNIDPHIEDYMIRLQDELLFLEAAHYLHAYFISHKQYPEAARVSICQIKHIYYRSPFSSDSSFSPLTDNELTDEKEILSFYDIDIGKFRKVDGVTKELFGDGGVGENENENENEGNIKEMPLEGEEPSKRPPDNKNSTYTYHAESMMSSLAKLVYRYGDARSKTWALLCQCYHFCLHDHYDEARDLLLMSHLQESIRYTDVDTQILFNRTLMQLGLCAFRMGFVNDSHSCLQEIYAHGRYKELLAQGIGGGQQRIEKTPEEEKAERKRQIPFHMHINLELLEAVHLISAMLLEVPLMAHHRRDANYKCVSRTFHKLLNISKRQVFQGPPENTRDFIMAASLALMEGRWKPCRDFILGLKVWQLLPNSQAVKEMVARKIQEEALRAHLFNAVGIFDTISYLQLADLFELPKNVVHGIISKMMIRQEIKAAWDQTTGHIIIQAANPTKLQSLSLQLTDTIHHLINQNEKFSVGVSSHQHKKNATQRGGDSRIGPLHSRNFRNIHGNKQT